MFSSSPLNQKPRIAVIGAWDTKGPELLEIARLIELMGCSVVKINIGVYPPSPPCAIDIDNQYFVESIDQLRKLDRPSAIRLMKEGILKLRPAEFAFDAIIGPGGTNGTELITAFMQRFPAVPSVCLSTVAQHENYSYTQDFPYLHLVNSVADIGGGVNSLLRPILNDVVGALIGRVWMRRNANLFAVQPNIKCKGSIAASQFGTTTPCVQTCAESLKEHGYETVIFHMVGSGGKNMEARIRKGEFSGLLDITITELADLYGNGIFSAGFERLSAAVEMGIPQVLAPGCLDMINLGVYEEVIKDPRFKNRTLHKCNRDVTVMRTTIEEYKRIAHHIVDKLKDAKNTITLLFPKKGLSKFDSPTNKSFAWYDPLANAYLLAEIKRLVNLYECKHIHVFEVDCHINDAAFAQLATRFLLSALHMPNFKASRLQGVSMFKSEPAQFQSEVGAKRMRIK